MLEMHCNDMRCLFPAQDGDDMTDMGDTDGDDWMNVSLNSHKLLWIHNYDLIFMDVM